jgi:cytochrome c peroxidase
MMRLLFLGAIICLTLGENAALMEEPMEETYPVPLGLPPIPWPEDNPYSEKKKELGRLLYFDKRLSADGSVSCASCHGVREAFADHAKVSIGIQGRKGKRNAQTVIDSAYHTHLFWDGRARSLEEQCKGPIANVLEMANASNPHEAHQECHERIKSIAGYRVLFKEAFGNEEATIDDIAKAVATFERTVLSGNSPFDRYMAGDKTAMTPEEIHGYRVFKHVGCDNCHFGPTFADGRFLNIGVGMDVENPDLGRYEVTKNKADWGAFRVPILRDVANTPPYMHDGSLNTLEEVVEYYNSGGIKNSNLHTLMRPLNLTDQEKQDLVSFLKALNGEGWEHIIEPEKLPE